MGNARLAIKEKNRLAVLPSPNGSTPLSILIYGDARLAIKDKNRLAVLPSPNNGSTPLSILIYGECTISNQGQESIGCTPFSEWLHAVVNFNLWGCTISNQGQELIGCTSVLPSPNASMPFSI